MYAPSDKKYAFKKLKYFPSAPQLACEIHQILTYFFGGFRRLITENFSNNKKK